MNQDQAPLAIQPTRKMGFFQRREDYPVITMQDGNDRIMLPVPEYRKIRGDASFWRFLFLLSFLAFCGLFLLVYLNPITVEKPLIVEKEIQVPVPTKCLFFCGK